MPPSRTNILAIEAPAYGYGPYKLCEIEGILPTAFTGFSAARIESERCSEGQSRGAVHTGFWGCGAYGGNRVLIALLQLIAARMAGLDSVVFHAGDADGARSFEEAHRIYREDVGLETGARDVSELVARIESMGSRCGVSDGN